MVLEFAANWAASHLLTWSVRDFLPAALKFDIDVVTLSVLLQSLPKEDWSCAPKISPCGCLSRFFSIARSGCRGWLGDESVCCNGAGGEICDEQDGPTVSAERAERGSPARAGDSRTRR